MRRSKEEIPCKLVGQTKIVIVVEVEVAFKEEVVGEAEEMLLEKTVDTGFKEVFMEEERTQ